MNMRTAGAIGAVLIVAIVLFVVFGSGDGGADDAPAAGGAARAPAAEGAAPAPKVEAPARQAPGATAEVASKSTTLPVGTVREKTGSDAAALALLAEAWSTGAGLSQAIAPEGLSVAVGSAQVRRFDADALGEPRRSSPKLSVEDCADATLNAVVGEPFLTAYFSVDAKIRAWPSDRAEWSSLRCYGLDAPERPAVRACVKDTDDGPRVAGMQVGLTSRPDTGKTVTREDRALATPAAPKAAVGETYNVVLVADKDMLNARAEPNADAKIVHRFSPKARGIESTGQTKTVEKTDWIELRTPDGTGWVNRHFVAHARGAAQMESDPRYVFLAESLLRALREKKTPSLGRRGLYVMHYGDPVRVQGVDWSVAAEQARKYDGSACRECIDGTMRSVVGNALTDALRDANAERAYGKMRTGANQSWQIPTKFSGFNLMTVFDPHDEACPDVDWMTAAFFFDEEDGEPQLVGVAFDEWSP